MAEQHPNAFDLIVIGSGPGGYVAAIRGAQLGMKTGCVERAGLGGTCLNIGCIPSKALLDSSHRFHELKYGYARRGIKANDVSIDLPAMMGFKDEVVKKMTGGVGFLLNKNKIAHIKGQATFTSPGNIEVKGEGGTQNYSAKNIIIATGSASTAVPGLPFDGKYVLSSTEALTLSKVPEKLIVVGAGFIGLELGSVWNRLGAQVQVLEFLDGILPPCDREMANALQKSLEKQGMKFKFKTAAQGVSIEGDKVKLKWKSGEQAGEEIADRVLVSVGRKPVTDGLGLEAIGVVPDKRGFVPVNARFETNVPGVFGIGDVIGGMLLAHKAEEEGIACVEGMHGKSTFVNYLACPGVVYTHPELAQVGLTEDQARARGEIKMGKFPFTANGRAQGMGETEGFVKVIGDAKTDRLLGVHILGAHAGEMIAEAVTAMEFAGSVEDVARAFHAHPTMNEVIKEAALDVEKMSIHK